MGESAYCRHRVTPFSRTACAFIGLRSASAAARSLPLFPLHRWSLPSINLSGIAFNRRSMRPWVYSIEGLISQTESEAFVGEAQRYGLTEAGTGSRLTRRQDAGRTKRKHSVVSRWRNNTFAWLMWDRVPDTLVERLVEVLRLPKARIVGGDPVQVARYAPGGYYYGHSDSMPLAQIRRHVQLQRGMSSAFPFAGRYATLLIFLRTPQKGGQLCFPFARASRLSSEDFGVMRNTPEDLVRQAALCEECRGLEISPKAGSAVLFYNHQIDGFGLLGDLDTDVWHAGCPVHLGEKWVANVWISVPLPEVLHSPIDGFDYSAFYHRWCSSGSEGLRDRYCSTQINGFSSQEQAPLD